MFKVCAGAVHVQTKSHVQVGSEMKIRRGFKKKLCALLTSSIPLFSLVSVTQRFTLVFSYDDGCRCGRKEGMEGSREDVRKKK